MNSKAAGYCRVDRGNSEQARREALDAQRHALEQYASQNHIELVTFYEDNGVSGSDPERPGLKRLLEDNQKGLFQTILVVSRGRLSRDSSQN